MKKALIALLIALCTLPLCARAEQVEFDPLQITLWGDNIEGYEWSCDYEDNGVLSSPFVEYVETENGVSSTYNFGVRAPGRAQVVFNYGANFALSMPERTMICTVIVDEDGSFTVRRAERYSGDHMLVVNLPSNPTTGVNWNYEEDLSGVVTLISEEYVPLDEFLEGAGGNTEYTFRVEKSGEALLLFDYADMWNPDAEAQETYAVLVSANDAMEISMTVDEQ